MPVTALPDLMIEPIVRAALLEDLGRAGDITTQAVVPSDARFAAIFAARQAGVVAGVDCARLAMTLMGAHFDTLKPDGSVIAPGDIIARVDGPAAAVLAGERVALNFLCHLSGVASQTAAYVAAVSGTGVRIAEIRKTIPGLRGLQKHAVKCGGGLNHRFGLDDAILIKDNHIAICGGIAQALEAARANAGHLVKIEIEVDTLAQLREALPYSPDVVLLDNFALDDLRQAVALAKGQTVLEASGGVNMTTVRAIAETGVDVISIGALTHSAPNFDIGLDAA